MTAPSLVALTHTPRTLSTRSSNNGRRTLRSVKCMYHTLSAKRLHRYPHIYIISLKGKVKDLEQSIRCIKLEMATSQHETDGTRSRQLPQNGRTTATTGHYVHNVHEPNNLGNLQRQMQEYTTKIELDMLRQGMDMIAFSQQMSHH